MESAITSKGQVTIPKAIREYLHVKPGDRVKFFMHPDGTVVLLPKLPVTALRGIVPPRGCPVTLEEMDDDGLLESDVHEVMMRGKIVAKLTGDPRGARFVVRGSTIDKETVEVVCRFLPEGILRIITVYAAEE